MNTFRPEAGARINNHNDCSQYSVLRMPSGCDTVSFTGGVPNGDLLKKLLDYKIPDMYSGRIMMSPSTVQRFLKRKVFSSSVRTVVKSLIPYEDCLYPVEKSVLSILKSASRANPDRNIEDIIHEIAPIHQKRLRAIQQPVFDELAELAKNMPEEQQKKFAELMEFTKEKLDCKPVVMEFSAKEFKYKLARIEEGIKSRNNPQEVSTMKKLMKMAQNFSSFTEDEMFEKVSAKKGIKMAKKFRVVQNFTRKQAENLRQISRVLQSSPLSKDRELNDLLIKSRARIYKIPVIYAFNRKSFIYDLLKITKELEDKKLAHKMTQTAIKLPTSKQDISAFIVKATGSSSEKIGFDMIYGTMGSIEHLTPAKRGGEDKLCNYALASVSMNEERAHKSFREQLKKHPETYQNCQKYVDRLIELYNDGTFKKLGLSRAYILSYVSKVYKMSPEENRLVIDISKLKQ